MFRNLLNKLVLLLCLLGSATLLAQPVCSDLFANPSGINPNLGANGISPFDLNNVPWQNTPWPASGTVLAGGNYYFGSLNVGNNYQLSVAPGQKATIYVNDTFDVRNFLQLNATGETRQLTLVVRATVAVNNLAEINALVFSAGTISINAQNVIIGGLAANGAISVGNSTVVRNQQAIDELVLPGLCTATVLPAARAHYPLDLCSAVSNGVISDLTGSFPATGINVAAVDDGQVLEAGDFSAAGNDYVNVPAAVLNGLGNFSLSLWFRLDAGNGFRELFSASSNNSDTELELYINASNEVRAGLKGTYHTFTGGSSSPVVPNNVWTQATLTRGGNQLCLYLNDQLVRCVTASTANLSVQRSAVGIWWRANGTRQDDFRGDIDEVLLFNQTLSQLQINQMYQNQQAGNSFNGVSRGSQCSECLADNFNTASLTDSWVTARSSGNFTPSVVDGRLRLTQALANQSTSATFQRLYPAANNLVVVEFDYYAWSPQSGTGADGVAVILSDANITPQPGSFGGSLGYAQRDNGDAGFAGGWLGIALDEYGNFSNPNEGRVGGPGFRPQSVSIRGAAAGNYRYLTGTAANLSPRIDARSSAISAPGHRYRITVDSRVAGQALVSVQRKTGSDFTDIIPAFNALSFAGQAPVPENFFLSFTGSTGGSNNNHELDNLSICALRSFPVGQQIDHFEFDYSGQALTCKPETFTIRACKNASCSELVTEPVSANLAPANSSNVNWIGGNAINFSGGTAQLSLRNTVAGSVTVGVSGSIPSTRPFSQTLCRAGAGNLTVAACSVSFADSGLVFEVPDGIANQPQQNILLSAVRKDNASQQCVPAFANVSRSVAFWSDYITPDATGRPVSWPVIVNNQNAGLTEAGRQSQTLAFNGQGQASIEVNYADAGQVQLNARYTGSVATADAGLIMNGADQFIRRPLGLCVQTGGECAAGDASCPAFRRAGEVFPLTISARAWQSGSTGICANPVTPNFTQTAIPLNHSLVAPLSGETGAVATTTYNHNRQLQAQTNVQQSVSEVGVFRFGSAAFNYLAMADAVPAAQSAATGRFYPKDFLLSGADITPACDSFSYMQQSFAAGFTLTARNMENVTTQNYTGNFATAATLLQAENDNDGNALTARLTGTVTPIWQQGVFTYTAAALRFNRASPAAQDGPYSQLTLAVQALDNDNVSIAEPDVNVDTANNCAATNNCTAKLIGVTDLRYGRLVLQNTAGPEEEPLPLVFGTEYWNGSAFVVNLADSCTQVDPLLLANPPGNSPLLAFDGTAQPMLNGEIAAGPIWIVPSGSRGNWLVEYQAPEHLRYQWRTPATTTRACDPAAGNYQQCPQADIMFGRFRGNPRQIFWRERFQ